MPIAARWDSGEVQIVVLAMSDDKCDTCVYVQTCPIYAVARETQIARVGPESFGCIWHESEASYKENHPDWEKET